MKNLLGVLICMIFAAGLATLQVTTMKAADQGPKVEKIVVATSVDNHEPVGENKEFAASVGTVSCWTKITGAAVPSKIKHVWYLGDKKVFEQSLDLKFASTRTWSTKSIKPGDWKVEVTDEAGTVLSSVTFTVK